MTIKKKSLLESVATPLIEDDDYYATEKKRIAEEAQKARRIHDADVQTHVTAMIPYYEDADTDCRRLLLTLNNMLIHRFTEAGMVYWSIFQKVPSEIREYSDIFGTDLAADEIERIIVYFQDKKSEDENMVEIGFDEDGEEDDGFFGSEKEDDDDSEKDDDIDRDDDR